MAAIERRDRVERIGGTGGKYEPGTELVVGPWMTKLFRRWYAPKDMRSELMEIGEMGSPQVTLERKDTDGP